MKPLKEFISEACTGKSRSVANEVIKCLCIKPGVVNCLIPTLPLPYMPRPVTYITIIVHGIVWHTQEYGPSIIKNLKTTSLPKNEHAE